MKLLQGWNLGWLEDGSPPWRMLVPLWWSHPAKDQFQLPLGCSLSWGRFSCHMGPCQTEFQPLYIYDLLPTHPRSIERDHLQWRENVFELGANIFTFSNLVPAKSPFTSKIVKNGYFIEKFKKYSANQLVYVLTPLTLV